MTEFHDEEPLVICGWCGAVQRDVEARLGVLGNLTHFRCRACGGDWHERGGNDDGSGAASGEARA